MELEGIKIAFLGDSITEGACTSGEDYTFWGLLGKETGAKVYGYGIGGTRIAPNRVNVGDPKFSRHFASRVEEMIPDADVVMVFGGTNDFGHGDAVLGKMSDRDENSFYGSLHVLYRKLIRRYPTSRIIIMTPLHRTGDTDATYNEFGIRRCCDLKGYVDAIREVAQYYSLPVLDLFKDSGLQPEVEAINERFFADGLHPNDEGHKVLSDLVKKFLMKL